MSLNISKHVLPHPRTGLKACINQYTWANSRAVSGRGLSLVFAHSTSNHKEQWEILMPRIFEECKDLVAEIWAIDAENHGESALLNEAALKTQVVGLEDYANLLACFLQHPLMMGKDVVAIGHSTSTCAWTLAAFQISLPKSPIVAFVFFEPVHVIQPLLEKDPRLIRADMNTKGVLSRKFTFSSRDEAEQYIRNRMPWKTWDERMIQSYLTFGFKDVAGDAKAVTTRCSKEQEVWNCPTNAPILAGWFYPYLCSLYPIHGIFGERPEMYSRRWRDLFFDKKDGRHMASVNVMSRTGHLLVQEDPDNAAAVIATVVKSLKPQSFHPRSKL